MKAWNWSGGFSLVLIVGMWEGNHLFELFAEFG